MTDTTLKNSLKAKQDEAKKILNALQQEATGKKSPHAELTAGSIPMVQSQDKLSANDLPSVKFLSREKPMSQIDIDSTLRNIINTDGVLRQLIQHFRGLHIGAVPLEDLDIKKALSHPTSSKLIRNVLDFAKWSHCIKESRKIERIKLFFRNHYNLELTKEKILAYRHDLTLRLSHYHTPDDTEEQALIHEIEVQREKTAEALRQIEELYQLSYQYTDISNQVLALTASHQSLKLDFFRLSVDHRLELARLIMNHGVGLLLALDNPHTLQQLELLVHQYHHPECTPDTRLNIVERLRLLPESCSLDNDDIHQLINNAKILTAIQTYQPLKMRFEASINQQARQLQTLQSRMTQLEHRLERGAHRYLDAQERLRMQESVLETHLAIKARAENPAMPEQDNPARLS